MKRKMIEIDLAKCNGCGQCIPKCPEGALQILDGKARLLSDLFCDGLGACVGTCPRGALQTIEREAEDYDEAKVLRNIVPQGQTTLFAHLRHLKEHGASAYLQTALEVLRERGIEVTGWENSTAAQSPCSGGCPGAADKAWSKPAAPAVHAVQDSELRQWPVQLHLVNPHAPFFQDADLLIAADCVAFACGGFHQKLLRGKVLIIFCPKLDNSAEEYVEKLSRIFCDNKIRSVTVARMSVPCCGGTEILVRKGLEYAGKTDQIPLTIQVVDLDGTLL